MPKDFGYINARIRGLRSKLLGPEFYNEALNASDFRAFVSVLAQPPYVEDVEEAQARYEGIKVVDAAVSRNFYRTARSILNFSDGEPGELIALLLLRYDLNNLKTIARAKHAGRSAEDISAGLLPAGELKPTTLETIAETPDMAAAAQAVAVSPTPLSAAFSKAAAQYASDGDLYALELALDRAYYRTVFKRLEALDAPPKFTRYMKRTVDATNLRTALSLRAAGASASDDLFIPGGLEINRSTFDGLVNDSSQGGLQVLSGTIFSSVADTTSLSGAEAVIRDVMEKKSAGMASDALGIGLAASYLRAKEAESAKIRLLARGKFYGVPRETLERELGDA